MGKPTARGHGTLSVINRGESFSTGGNNVKEVKYELALYWSSEIN